MAADPFLGRNVYRDFYDRLNIRPNSEAGLYFVFMEGWGFLSNNMPEAQFLRQQIFQAEMT
jgi:hypothetical protein